MFAPSICDSDMLGMCGARRTVVRACESLASPSLERDRRRYQKRGDRGPTMPTVRQSGEGIEGIQRCSVIDGSSAAQRSVLMLGRGPKVRGRMSHDEVGARQGSRGRGRG